MEFDAQLRPTTANGGRPSPLPTNAGTKTPTSATGGAQAAASGGVIPRPRTDGADTSDGPSGLGAATGQTSQQNDGEDGIDAKRPRACEACRGLKVRCEPDPNDDGPCKRCKKAGRNCVITVPTRKRQKKTDSRVAELEKKIDALTASLQSRGTPASIATTTTTTTPRPTAPIHGAMVDDPAVLNMVWRNAASSWPPTPAAGMGHMAVQGQNEVASTSSEAQRTSMAPSAGQKRKFDEARDGEDQQPREQSQKAAESIPLDTASIWARIAHGDIVDRGLITMEKAAELFARYNDHMILHLPAVVFPPGTTVAELRKTKPTLFFSIMAAAAAEMPMLQKVLQKELMTIFAEKIIITGEKNVELIQALQVAVIWYWPPEHFEELKFYQLVHIAAVMAIDIGLGQKWPQRKGKFIPDQWRLNPFRRSTPPDPTSIENRRAWLTCYFLAANTSMALHRPNLVRWNPFISECMGILETSPDAAPTDKYFCHLVWTHRLAEEVGMQFSLDDPTSVVNIADARTQYALKGLERDLEKYRASVPKDLMQPSLQMSFHVINLYMHELALHSSRPPNTEPFRGPLGPETLRDGFSGVSSEPLTAAHISALSACLTAINGTLDTFLAMDIFSVRCLPVFNFVRVAYALVILIKLYFSCAAPDSELGKVISKDDMRVQQHLDALLDKFRATAANDLSRPAAKFLVVLVMLRSWFFKQCGGAQKDQNQNQNQDQDQPPAPPPTPALRPDLAQTANTPLQLLSEVATGAGSAGVGASSSTTPAENPTAFRSWADIRQNQQPFFHSESNDTPANPHANDTPPPSSSSMPPPPFPPLAAPSANLAAAMAPGIPAMMPNGQPGFNPDYTYGLNPGLELEGMGLFDAQDSYATGVRFVMNEPWVEDMFQHMPGSGNFFNF